jgi:hypothetical protein
LFTQVYAIFNKKQYNYDLNDFGKALRIFFYLGVS